MSTPSPATAAINAYRPQVADAMQGLATAFARLSALNEAIEASLKTTAPGHPDEALSLRLSRCCRHLASAAADAPPPLWHTLIQEGRIKPVELATYIQTGRQAA